MFYAHFVLSKKGPLARIWLAAHWDKKLTKAHVFETNIEGSVEAIIQPKVKLALRTSGHLLLGVVRIYSRKAKYLLADCNEAFVKIKMAFRPGVVDMPEENREAAAHAITLPETFHDFDTTMADLNDIEGIQNQFHVNQSRPEEITMREDLGNITLVGDDGFGDMGFEGGPNIIQDAHMDDTLYVKNTENNLLLEPAGDKDAVDKPMDIDFDAQPRDDGFGAAMNDFDDGPAGVEDDDDSDHDNFGGGVDDELFGDNFVGESAGLFEEPPVPEVPIQPETEPAKEGEAAKEPAAAAAADVTQPQEISTAVPDQTTLIPNEAEAFALEPIDVTSLGTERKAKRKRKLVIDDQKGIASETMKLQLSDTGDIVTTLDLAPPTKKLMHWKETGGVEKLFALSGRPMISKRITKLFNRNLITKPMKEEDDPEGLDLRDDESLRSESVRSMASSMAVTGRNFPDRESMHAIERARDASNIADESLMPPPADLPSVVEDRSRVEQSFGIPADQSSTMLPAEDSFQPPALQPEAYPSSEEDNDDIFGDMPADDFPEKEPSLDGSEVGEEEREERRWGKRTQQMMHILTRQLQNMNTASFKELVSRNNRKQVASKFYTFLVLKKQQQVELEQTEPYGDITVWRGPQFEEVY